MPATCPCPEPDQSNPCPPSRLLKTHFNIIFTFARGYSKWTLSLRFTLQNSVHTSARLHAFYMPCLIHFLNLITRIIFGEEYSSLGSLHSVLHSPVTPCLFGQNILLNTLFSNALSLRSFLSVNNNVSKPYKLIGYNVLQYTLIFILLDTKLENKKIYTQ